MVLSARWRVECAGAVDGAEAQAPIDDEHFFDLSFDLFDILLDFFDFSLNFLFNFFVPLWCACSHARPWRAEEPAMVIDVVAKSYRTGSQ
jgi:hypothetical protein